MEHYTEDELGLIKEKKSLFVAFAILITTLFIDLASLINNSLNNLQSPSSVDYLYVITIDLEIAIISFIVSNYISYSIKHSISLVDLLIFLSTVLGFASLVICKVAYHDCWLVVTLIFACITLFLLACRCLKLINYIKKNGRRLPY